MVCIIFLWKEVDKMLDYLIVGAGLAGATFARIMTNKGCRCIVIDKMIAKI